MSATELAVAPPTVTRGGHVPTGVGAQRRAMIDSTAGPKAARTRDRLLGAARVVFARHGYLDTTVDQIVTEAGVARGSFYSYFSSKIEIFRHLAATIDRRVDRAVVAFDHKAGDPVATLLISNRNYLAMVRDNADLYRLVEQVAVVDATVAEARHRSRQRHINRVARSIGRWQDAGWADPTIDAATTAAALVAMLSGYAQWTFNTGTSTETNSGPTSDDAAAERLTEIWVAACRLAPPS